MDRWLDDLARAAASGVSRRKLLRRILTGVLAGATGTAVARRASAGAVVCSGEQVNCGGGCVSLGSDRNNCGAYGRVCPSGMVCSGGGCASQCASAFTLCPPGNCVQIMTDPNNCGACGVVCPAAPGAPAACVRGRCGGEPGCPPATSMCGSVCTTTASDFNNCGACGHVCPVGQVCSGGMCATSCAGAFVNCGDNCVFVQIDPHNCGDCGVVCPQNQACVRGTCVPRN